MGKEVSVNPEEVDQHCKDMTASISDLKSAAKFDGDDKGKVKLKSMDRLHDIIADFEEAMKLYTALADNDIEKVDYVKEKMIEKDSRLADWRLFD